MTVGRVSLASETGEELRQRVRVSGRIAGGASAGLLLLDGVSLGMRVGVHASPAVVLEAGAYAATGICLQFCAITGGDMSLVFLPLDTFSIRIGGGVRRVSQKDEQSGIPVADADAGVIVGVGNRWDWKEAMVSVEWLGAYVPIGPISTRRPPPPGAPAGFGPSPVGVEIRAVTVTVGFGT